MIVPGVTQRSAIAVAVWLALAVSLLGQDVKWRTPRLPTKTASQPAVAQVPTPVAQVPFRPPPAESLPPPVLHSVVTSPPATAAPAILPPETIAPGPTEGWDPLGSFFSHADDTLPEIEEWEAHTPPLVTHIYPSKPGLFQKFGLSGSFIEGGTEGRAPAIADISTYSTMAIPFPIREWPLNITTGADARTLSGPTTPDLPPTLYDAYVDFTWNLRITQRSSHVFSVAPGYYSDFQQSSGHALRVTGKWVGAYEVVRNRITLITGTIYLGRDDLKMLPMTGLVFTPNDWSRFEAMFPNPRAALRLRSEEVFEDWLYTGFDFYGGQTYAIERLNGSIDRVSILDSRAVLGYERRRQGGAGWNMESGWVFDRQVRYHNDHSEDFRPKPTYYFRIGFTL